MGYSRPMSRPVRTLFAACLVLFPLLFIFFAGTRIHPGLSGTAADQIRQLGVQAAGRWQLVHSVLALASLLGLATVLILWTLVARGRSGPVAILAHAATAIGAAGAALLSGVVLMEAGLVAPLAKACASAPPCLSTADAPFAQEFARLGWGDVPPLGWSGVALAFGVLILAAAGWILGPLRIWEAPVLAVSQIGILFTNPGLHGNARFPLIVMLVATAGLALRVIGTGALSDAPPLFE